MKYKTIFLGVIVILSSCTFSKYKNTASVSEERGRDRVVLQPFEKFSKREAEAIMERLQKRGVEVSIAEAIPLPAMAWYAPRRRFRADSLIAFLQRQTPEGIVKIGLTHKDISMRNQSHADFGIMGLGYKPGRACVVSSFRIRGKNRWEKMDKVILHEFAHTRGLNHCPVPTCLMRDAEGKDHLDEEEAFCKACDAFLNRKGYRIL